MLEAASAFAVINACGRMSAKGRFVMEMNSSQGQGFPDLFYNASSYIMTNENKTPSLFLGGTLSHG